MSQSINKAYVTGPAPKFTAKSLMPDGQFEDISLDSYKGKWVVLFFYPLDFTFVCPTEIIEFSDKAADFKNINCELLAASIDSHFSHFAWCEQSRNKGGLGKLNIPVLSDLTRTISRDYGVYLEEAGHTLRGTFIIDPEGIIRHATFNDPPVGRSVAETLRLVQAYQYVAEHGEVCPSSWTPGAKTIQPANKSAYFESVNK